MSAFQCSDKHLAFLALAIQKLGRQHGATSLMHYEIDEIARVLKAENARSVTSRYAHRADMCKPCPACGEVVCDPRVGYTSGRGMTAPCPFARLDESAWTEAKRFAEPMLADAGAYAVHVIKLAECYAYQANEHDAWESSQAKAWIERLQSWAVASLPGYDAAPWGLS